MPKVGKNMGNRFDVIIVGGGIIGASIAYELTQTFPEVQYLLIEKESQLGQENTAKSAACFRSAFSSTVNIKATRYTIEKLKAISNKRDIGLRTSGYLWMLGLPQLNKLQSVFEKIAGSGVDVTYLGPDRLAQKVPGLMIEPPSEGKKEFEGYINDPNLLPEPDFARFFKKVSSDRISVDTIAGGYFCGDCGFLEPSDLVDFLRSEIRRSKNGRTRTDTEVMEITYEHGRVEGVKLRNDERILADKVVVAAGIWSNKLLAPHDLHVDAHPVMRQFFHIELSGESCALSDIPMVIFPGGAFMRSSPEGLMVGYAHHNEDEVERSSGRRSIYHSGLRFYLDLYLPGFQNLRSPNYVWGHYHTTPDDAPIIVNRDDGLATVCGCSGSGIMKAHYLGYLEAHALSGCIDRLPPEDKENLALMTNERFAKDEDGDYLDKSKWITEELVL